MSSQAILKAINKVQSALASEGIKKGRKNAAQGYSFRGIDDMYNVLSPMLAENQIVVLPSYSDRQVVEHESKKETLLFYVTLKGEFTFKSAEDGSEVKMTTYGEAMDSGDKATNKAMSAALKYAFMQTFTIPTEGDNDSENQTHEVRRAPSGSGAGFNQECFEKLPDGEKEPMRLFAADIEALVDDSRAEEAYDIIENKRYDDLRKPALWSLLGSKTRSAIKAIGTARRAA